jgi:hypothetical protein
MTDKIDAAVASMVKNLEAKTGRSLGQWVRLAKASRRAKHKELIDFLKSEHGLTHGYANLVALEALKTPGRPASAGDLVAGQYSGSKAALRPIYDALIAAMEKFGSDVEVSPKKAYVSVRRNKQFAIVQPSTAERVDVGLNLKGVKPAGRLEAAGSFNAMVSHRVRVTDRREVDAELIAWLRRAYDAA